ncbi:P27 family phage terminase small subunit [Clostridium sp. HBUAS56017]|uniref:P27 family phage terminase small subunit n=1 Tax=Clostridium sp. HBUAS56017 TaxID=2571128 RepID=UPI0011783760|nr:P27 family phage terminase small subunit [Clostridium sp. HBUAS56017]
MASARKIKDSLIKQLENKDANVEHFLGLIDDYIWYFNEEKAMQKDIKIRGKTYKSTSASGYEVEKENPSVKNAVMYNKQKLAILKELGLTTENVVSDKDDKL